MSQYIKQVYEMGIGGGEEATIVELRDGKVIVLAFDLIGVYENLDHYLDGDRPALMPTQRAWFEIDFATP